ncbi:YifB family Mg chelatase-like AAA ATPase [Patescibacteria group bacterium]|nr:YifB family Mg chelatase-like AAA ATPase [Patescibacteria group bacterium]
MKSYATLSSAALFGLEAWPVNVEVDIGAGLPAFTIVGLPDKAVEESRERVRSAIRNSGFVFPNKRITVNLAPADIKKEGPAYDLAIALGVLIADKQTPYPEISDVLILGELALDGSVRPINGVLPIALCAQSWEHNQMYVPDKNGQEGALVSSMKIFGISSLCQLVEFISGRVNIAAEMAQIPDASANPAEFDFAEVRGQENAKRALEIAATGHHNILMSGPPGSGKTMLSHALAGILPPLGKEEILEVTQLYSVAGQLKQGEHLIRRRPFRHPHHTTSSVALVGGGTFPKPGEISLSHKGVLFLDELPEFPRSVLEALRQPLEDKIIAVSRAQGSVIFPADFILVASRNPCPCGYFGDPNKECTCSAHQIEKYGKRISGPLLDRIDLHVEVPRLPYDEMTSKQQGESSAVVRDRVIQAREIQKKRFGREKTNSQMRNKEVEQFCKTNEEGSALLRKAVDSLNLSGRGYIKILKLARTIADLENSPSVMPGHIAEALQYRPKK